jgi:hypothetical protein
MRRKLQAGLLATDSFGSSLGLSIVAVALLSAGLWGLTQDPAPPAAPPPPPVLENTGKPILLPFQCTEEDIQKGGLSCTEEDPCPVYLELGAVDGSGSRVLAAGNLHTSAVTLYSVLLQSDDLGHTWREPHSRVRAAGLDHIQFLDAETGWVSGLVLSPLPQEPFLMVTQDAGKTWRQRPILSESSENRLGSIQQFSFGAKNSGSLIVDRGQGSDGDRYELYESPDAGENWTIKESSTKPLRLRRPPPPPSSDWRVRADARTQAFHLEHRAAPDRWSSLAAFAIKVPPCKPPPPSVVEEPPATPVPPPPVIKK